MPGADYIKVEWIGWIGLENIPSRGSYQHKFGRRGEPPPLTRPPGSWEQHRFPEGLPCIYLQDIYLQTAGTQLDFRLLSIWVLSRPLGE